MTDDKFGFAEWQVSYLSSVICHGGGAWARDLALSRAPGPQFVLHSHQVG